MNLEKTVSPKKHEANRRNALRSTGPKTSRGKRAVALNAIKQGLFAKHVLVTVGPGKENQAEFNGLLTGLYKHFQPQGMLESFLVETVAACIWKRRRVLRYEAGQIRRKIDDAIAYEQHLVARELSRQRDHLLQDFVDRNKDGLVDRNASDFINLNAAAEQNQPAHQRPGQPSASAQGARPKTEGPLPHPNNSGSEAPAPQSVEIAINLDALILPTGEGMDIILRYAARLDRELYRALHQLERIQRHRKGESVPPPVNVNVARGL